MAEANIPQITTEVTGHEAQDQEALVQRQVADAIAKYEASQAAKAKQTFTAADLEAILAGGDKTPKAQPIKVPIGGQEYTFSSLEELGQQVTAALAARQQPVVNQAPAAPAVNDEYDEAKFTELLDPTKGGSTPKAMEYVLKHTGQYKALEAQLGALAQQNQALKMRAVSQDIKELVPSFKPKSPQEVAVIDQIRQQLGGSADNAYAWEAAYAVAVNRGLIKPGENTQQSSQTQSGQAPPPYVGRSSTSVDEESELIKRAYGLPLDQLKALREQIAAAKRQ